MINTGAIALQVGMVDGLLLSFASTTTVTIGIGAARSSDNTDDIDIASQKTVDISTTGANALDTGSATSNTWYYVYVIKNPSTGVTAGLFSTSSTDPTMPSGYTKKRRIGSVRYTPSGIAQFICMGQGRTRHYEWMGDIANVQALTNGSATTWTDVDLSSYLPATCTVANLMGHQYGDWDSAICTSKWWHTELSASDNGRAESWSLGVVTNGCFTTD